MSSIGQMMARELVSQFYRWELRGRGWLNWNRPVALEPPFRPFDGHYLLPQPVIDDGRSESLGSRLVRGLGLQSVLGFEESRLPEPPAELEDEPKPKDFEPGSLVELQIALPPDYKAQGDIFEQFLFSIGYAQAPIAFEVVGSKEELVVQLTASSDDATIVREQLKAFFPEAVIVAGEDQVAGVLIQDPGEFAFVELGLEREFMAPLSGLKPLATDPLVAIAGALDRLEEGESGVFQVLFEPTRNPWATSVMRAVTWQDDEPFFANDWELVKQAREKLSRPLFAVAMRLVTKAPEPERAHELIRSLAGGLRALRVVGGNALKVLESEEADWDVLLSDIVLRRTRRSGMILNSDELITLAHLPTAAVRARSLRRVNRLTKQAPRDLLKADGVCLGHNDHEGVLSEVWLSDTTRLSHCHILGGTGSGKSTLLSQIAVQDIISGRGIAVIDPHGDLIDLLIPHIPKERMDDVILFDPTDNEYAIAFNPLGASSERERDLLATDFIAVMKQNTKSWGDQMSSLLGNAVLAFLHSKSGGTLPELRRFLSDQRFRKEFLAWVTNYEVVYFWEHEAQLANKTAVGSILTRLDSLLRYESLLHILGQRDNKLDFAAIMDGKKIFLARLAKGLIGQENAHLLGSLLVSRFYQTAIARQGRSRENRVPYFLLMDEAGDLLTSTVSEILKGTRKYGLGLTLAHQSLSQLRHDDEVYGAVMGSCFTKVCFQVGGDDARKMAEEFGGFEASDLMNQPPCFSIARVGPRYQSFNLEVSFIPEAPRNFEEAYQDVLSKTRERYSTLRASIRSELAELRKVIPPENGADPFSKLAAKEKKEREERLEEKKTESSPRPPAPVSAELPEAGDSGEIRHDPSAESIKNEIIQVAGSWGYSYATEKPVNDNTGRVDIVLTLGSVVIACEISVTTSADHEVGNLKKCLRAGYTQIVYVCDATHRRRRTEEKLRKSCPAEEIAKIEFLTKRQFLGRLGEVAAKVRSEQAPEQSAVGKTVLQAAGELSPAERKDIAEEAWEEIARNMGKPTQKGL